METEVRVRPEPEEPPEVPEGKVNITDPDSKPIPIGFGFVQGYNAQAAVNEQHIVVAAEITNKSTDFSQLLPMVEAIIRELERTREAERAGRAMDHEREDAFERLRAAGYM